MHNHFVGFVVRWLICVNLDTLFAGSTTGSTHVESQLKEIKDQQLRESKEQKENKDPGQEKFSKNRYSYGISKERLEADQAVFKVYKGVKCFDFSKDKNIIVTGGKAKADSLY